MRRLALNKFQSFISQIYVKYTAKKFKCQGKIITYCLTLKLKKLVKQVSGK